MKTWVHRTVSVSLFISVGLLISGCLSGSYSALVRYDVEKDEFTVLNVYQRIGAAVPADGEYLYQLWRNRDHIIRVPNLDILAMPAMLRMGPGKFAAINLGSAPQKLEITETHVALDRIRVLPGTFFMRGDALCYYDQVVIPGSVIDQALPEFGEATESDIHASIDKELKRRADGGKRFPWADVRKLVLTGVKEGLYPPKNPATPETKPAEPQSHLEIYDDETLALMRKGISEGTLKLTREKEVFRLQLPFSDADAAQIKEIADAVVEAIEKDAREHTGELSPFAKFAPKLLPAFAVTKSAHSIQVKVDLGRILKELSGLYSMQDELAPPTPDEQKQTTEALAALKAHHVSIDERLTVQELARNFLAGTAKSDPSDKPVTAGDGLVQEAPGAAKQP